MPAACSKKLLVILNDNKMSICPRVGGVAEYLDRLRIEHVLHRAEERSRQESSTRCRCWAIRSSGFWRKLKEVDQGRPARRHAVRGAWLPLHRSDRRAQHRRSCASTWRWSRTSTGPVLLHVVTEKGHGFKPAAEDPVFFHTPAPFTCEDEGGRGDQEELVAGLHRRGQPGDSSTQMQQNPRVTVMTAAMCQGNKLEAGSRRLSRPLLRHRHLRIARRGLRRRAGQGRPAADRRYLQHVPAAQLRSDLPGSRAAEPAGHVPARPRRPDRSRRPDASRRVRPRLHAAVSRTWS